LSRSLTEVFGPLWFSTRPTAKTFGNGKCAFEADRQMPWKLGSISVTRKTTGTLFPLPLSFLIQSAVQFKCSADQRQMRKCLREIPQMLARWTQLFCKETQVICVTQRFFQEQSSSSSFHLTAPGQTFDQFTRCRSIACEASSSPSRIKRALFPALKNKLRFDPHGSRRIAESSSKIEGC
jgi:hypothetical protein